MKKFLLVALPVSLVLNQWGTAVVADNLQQRQRKSLADSLGWVPTSVSEDNLCGGYYKELPIIFNPSAQPGLGNRGINIHADESDLPFHGRITLRGNVIATQPDQELRSDLAHVYRDPDTGKVSGLDLFGHVRAREPGNLLVGDKAHISPQTWYARMEHAHYRFIVDSYELPKETVTWPTNDVYKIDKMTVWGQASEVVQEKEGLYRFEHATYTTCSPENTAWHIKARRLTIDKNSGRGHAKSAVLYMRGMPVFYMPYVSFPIDDRRKTGFLGVGFGKNSTSGFSLSAPFYWNMAPNYDLTIRPRWMQKRGVLVENVFRYLTPNSHGQLELGILPNDKEFRRYKARASSEHAGDPTLGSLLGAPDTRKFFSWQHQFDIDPYWHLGVDYSYVSDSYYFRDLDSHFSDIDESQLLRKGEVSYTGEHWTFVGGAQAYQTLNRVDATRLLEQYQQYPYLNTKGAYSDLPYGLAFDLDASYVNFNRKDDQNNSLTGNPFAIGTRLNAAPHLSLPLQRAYGYLKPGVRLLGTQYSISNPIAGQPEASSRLIPVVDVDSGLYFDRYGGRFQETIEPRLYYLYVPYRNQDKYPVFDISYPAFGAWQLFTYNRFSGWDRIGDANQVTLALTSRLLEQDSGFERATFTLGQIYYMKDREVTICGTAGCIAREDPRYQDKRSPILGQITYNFNPNWSSTVSAAYDKQRHYFVNQRVAMNYKSDGAHIVNFGYNYVSTVDLTAVVPEQENLRDLKEVFVNTAWPLSIHWNGFAEWHYNLQKINRHLETYLYGLEYNSCCWAVRFAGSRSYTGYIPATSSTGKPDNRYRNSLYLQIQLKSLGNIGAGDASDKLAELIPGYNDRFRGS